MVTATKAIRQGQDVPRQLFVGIALAMTAGFGWTSGLFSQTQTMRAVSRGVLGETGKAIKASGSQYEIPCGDFESGSPMGMASRAGALCGRFIETFQMRDLREFCRSHEGVFRSGSCFITVTLKKLFPNDELLCEADNRSLQEASVEIRVDDARKQKDGVDTPTTAEPVLRFTWTLHGKEYCSFHRKSHDFLKMLPENSRSMLDRIYSQSWNYVLSGTPKPQGDLGTLFCTNCPLR